MHSTQMEYNSTRELMDLREYGRNVHKLAAYVKNIEDKDKRTDAAKVLISLMRELNPTTSNTDESTQRLWDHLHQMTDFELEVNGDFPPPEPEMLFKKPERIDPVRSQLKMRHYGRNLELLVERALEMEEGSEEQYAAIAYIGRLMKTFYSKGNKDAISDAVILKELARMSANKLKITAEKVEELQLFELPKQQRRGRSNNNNSNKGSKKRSNNSGGRRRGRRRGKK